MFFISELLIWQPERFISSNVWFFIKNEFIFLIVSSLSSIPFKVKQFIESVYFIKINKKFQEKLLEIQEEYLAQSE